MRSKESVPVQKGPIHPDHSTEKNTPQPIKQMRQLADNAMIYRNQQLEVVEPKQ